MGKGQQYGSLAGAAAGSYWGPMGAGVGGTAGGTIGSLFDSEEEGPKIPWDQYNARMGQINSFADSLASARDRYENSLRNMYTTAFNFAMPNIAAQYAGKGFTPDSGAFAAELARQSTLAQSQLMPSVFQAERQDLQAVDNARGNAWGALFGASNKSSEMGWQGQRQDEQNLGSLFGQLAMSGKNQWGSGGGPTSTNKGYTPSQWSSFTDDGSRQPLVRMG